MAANKMYYSSSSTSAIVAPVSLGIAGPGICGLGLFLISDTAGDVANL